MRILATEDLGTLINLTVDSIYRGHLAFVEEERRSHGKSEADIYLVGNDTLLIEKVANELQTRFKQVRGGFVPFIRTDGLDNERFGRPYVVDVDCQIEYSAQKLREQAQEAGCVVS